MKKVTLAASIAATPSPMCNKIVSFFPENKLKLFYVLNLCFAQ